jgi:hypothetical protein
LVIIWSTSRDKFFLHTVQSSLFRSLWVDARKKLTASIFGMHQSLAMARKSAGI